MTKGRFQGSIRDPRLPLTECSAGASCPCAYKHYANRRGPPRRASPTLSIEVRNRGSASPHLVEKASGLARQKSREKRTWQAQNRLSF